MIRGVGPVYAKKLVRAFGEKVFDVIIETTPDRLREVDGIGQTLSRPECDSLACLDLNGFCDFASTAERAGNVGCELFCSDSARTKA